MIVKARLRQPRCVFGQVFWRWEARRLGPRRLVLESVVGGQRGSALIWAGRLCVVGCAPMDHRHMGVVQKYEKIRGKTVGAQGAGGRWVVGGCGGLWGCWEVCGDGGGCKEVVGVNPAVE